MPAKQSLNLLSSFPTNFAVRSVVMSNVEMSPERDVTLPEDFLGATPLGSASRDSDVFPADSEM